MEQEQTQRALMALMPDVAALVEATERVRVQVEALAGSLQAWYQVQPKGLWVLDQAATTQKVPDWTGGGANESALVGTTVGTSSVPGFSYGWPPRFALAASAAAAAAAARRKPYIRSDAVHRASRW